MFGAEALTDDNVRAAVSGSRPDVVRVAETLLPQVRLMIAARLSPTPAQLDAVDEITQEVMLSLTTGISRLKNQTVDGLRGYLSGIVMRKVAGALQGRGQSLRGLSTRSLDSTVASFSHAGPLWQFLSASGTSLFTMISRAELTELLLATLGKLKTEYREIITLAFFDQLSMTAIASLRKISRPAASMMLIRAVQDLRNKMMNTNDSGIQHVNGS